MQGVEHAIGRRQVLGVERAIPSGVALLLFWDLSRGGSWYGSKVQKKIRRDPAPELEPGSTAPPDDPDDDLAFLGPEDES